MTTCLVCHSEAVDAFLDLNETALANKFLRPEEAGKGESCLPATGWVLP